MPTYLSQVMHIGDAAALFIIVFVQLVMMASLPAVGLLSDRVGRKPVLVACALGFLVLALPSFLLISTGHLLLAVVGLLMLGLCLALFLGTEPSTLPALFPAPNRYGGMAIGYNLSTSVFGGTAPLISTFLIGLTHNDLVPAYYIMLAAAIGIWPILAIPETARVSIRGTAIPGTTPAPAAARPGP
jgi:MFS transporter, MHS family, proline/betaine transporter